MTCTDNSFIIYLEDKDCVAVLIDLSTEGTKYEDYLVLEEDNITYYTYQVYEKDPDWNYTGSAKIEPSTFDDEKPLSLVSENKYPSDYMQGEIASIGVQTALGRFDEYCRDNNIDLDRTDFGFKK